MSEKPAPFILRIHFANSAEIADRFLRHLKLPPSPGFMETHRSAESKHIIEVALDRKASPAAQLTQLERVTEGLTIFSNFDFVGPVCPRETDGTYRHRRSYMQSMLLAPYMEHGWACFELGCRKSQGRMEIRREDASVMTYREFMLLLNYLQTQKMNGELTYGTYRQAASQDFGGRHLIPATQQVPKSITINKQDIDSALDSLKKNLEVHALKVYKDIATEADKMLRFMAGLNIQDLSIKDQREFKERVNEMMQKLAQVKE